MLNVEMVLLSPQQKDLLERYADLRYHHLASQDALIMQNGQINLNEGRFLGQIIANLESKGPIIEVGTLFGWSTRVICLFVEKGRQVISVDNYSWNPFDLPPDLHFEITKLVLRDALSAGYLDLRSMDNKEFYKIYSGPSPALIFIDADHEYEAVKADIQGSIRLGAKVICGHDYDESLCPGVVRAVNEFGGPQKLLERMWVLR